MARIQERFIHRGKIVDTRIKSRANAIGVPEGGQELERSREKAFAIEEIDERPCAGRDDVIAYRRRDNCPRIKQDLGTCRAREMFLAERIAAVAIGPGGHTEQPAVVLILPPRQQRRVFRQELPQSFDIIVVDDAAGFGYRPFESLAEPLFYLFKQVLPAWKPIFPRQHKLGIAL